MAYIGNQNPTGFVGRLPKQDLTGATGGTLALSNPVSSSHDIELFINHVRQEPETSYQAAGTVVTLQGYTVSATDDIYVNYKGLAQLTSTVDDGSIGDSKITSMSASKLTGALPAISGAALTGLSSGSQVIAQLSMSADDNNVTEQQWNRATFNVIDFDNYASTANVAKTSGVQSGAGFLVPVTGYYQVYFNLCLGQEGADQTTRDAGALISKFTGSTETIIASTHGRYSGNDISEVPFFLSVIENLQANDEVIFRHYLNTTNGNAYDVFAAAANDASHAYYPNGSANNNAMKRGTYCGILKVG